MRAGCLTSINRKAIRRCATYLQRKKTNRIERSLVFFTKVNLRCFNIDIIIICGSGVCIVKLE